MSIERREPLQTALQGTSACAMVCRKIIDLPHTAVRARLGPIKARPHTFVKFTWHGNRLSTGLQGTSARTMVCRKITDPPRTAVQALHPPFLQFTRHGNRLSTGLQGISARAMVCRKITDRPRTGNEQPSQPAP